MSRKDYIFRLKLRDALRDALLELARNPAASVSISAGGGSKSYTNRDIEKIRKELEAVELWLQNHTPGAATGLEINYARWC